MSNYKNFIEDFPNRCKDLLLLVQNVAEANNREVTLTLMVASAGFLIPFERLRDDGMYLQPAADRLKFPGAAAKLDDLLESEWGTTGSGGSGMLWHMGPLKSPALPIDDWPEMQNSAELSPKTKVGKVIMIIRHALAHGNIFTLPDQQSQIKAIVFVCGGVQRTNGKLKPYEFVRVSPAGFRFFLLNWFEFLISTNVVQNEVLDALEKAAA